MKTACVILNYNVGKLVEELVNSIKLYKKINYIVIVDNNSRDDSITRLEKIKKQDVINKIHIIYNKENLGYGYGNNVGIRYSIEVLNVDYILIANPDIKIEEYCFNELLGILTCDEMCVAVTATAISLDGVIQESAWIIPSPEQYIFSSSSIINRVLNRKLSFSYSKQALEKKEVNVDCILGAMLLIKGNIVYQNALYDEDVFLFCEETILGIKLKKNQYITKLRTDIFYVHNHSSSIKKRD